MMLFWYLETSNSSSIYIIKVGLWYKSSLFSFMMPVVKMCCPWVTKFGSFPFFFFMFFYCGGFCFYMLKFTDILKFSVGAISML